MKKVIITGVAAVLFSGAMGVASAYDYSKTVKAKGQASCCCKNCTCSDCNCTDCSNCTCDEGCCDEGCGESSGCTSGCCK